MNRELLERPFLATEIRQREGGNGKTLDYVEGHAVIARLNEAFDGNWDFIVKSFEVSEARDEVLVVGRLMGEGITKMQFGSSTITRSRKDNQPVSIADDLKAAATDALKKCATLFGVGLHLYAGKSEVGTQREQSPQPGKGPSSQTTTGRITSKQHSYLLTLSRERGLTRREVDARCQERFGVVLDHVTRSEASLLIEELSRPEVPAQMQQPERQAAGGVH